MEDIKHRLVQIKDLAETIFEGLLTTLTASFEGPDFGAAT